MRIRLAVTGAGVAGIAVTTAVAVEDSFALAYENAALHAAVLTAEGMVGLLAAFLVFGRARRTSHASDLLLCCGLTLLAATVLAFGAVPATLDLDDPRFVAWAGLLGRAAGAALLAAAALTAPELRAWARPHAALALTLGVAGAVTVAVALVAPQLPHPTGPGYPERLGIVTLEGPPGALALRVLSAALLLAAAWGFSRRAERERDWFLGGLAIGCVLASLSRANFVIHPAHELGWLATGDLFAVLFYAVVLAAAAVEIRRIWRAEAAAAALEERRRLARDLHDGLVQELASVMRNLRGSDSASPPMARARAAAGRAIGAARLAIAALDGTHGQTLADALEEIALATAEREATAVDLDLDPTVDAEPAVRQALALITSEAITNAARHGHATVVHVRLRGPAPVQLSVADEGDGFELARHTAGGHGLTSMRQRATLIGATLKLTSRPGAGTSIEVSV
jgi:signal transduction histidine kinase